MKKDWERVFFGRRTGDFRDYGGMGSAGGVGGGVGLYVYAYPASFDINDFQRLSFFPCRFLFCLEVCVL